MIVCNRFFSLSYNLGSLRQILRCQFFAEYLDLMFQLSRISRYHATDALSSDVLCIIHHLDENKTSVASILAVLSENGMGSGATTCERVKDNTVGTGGNMEYALDETNGFRSIKGNFPAKDVFQFLLCLIGMTDFGVSPKVCDNATFHLSQIGFTSYAACSHFCEIVFGPLTTLHDYFGKFT